MTDKEKIRAEIERRLDDLYEKLPDGNNVVRMAMTTDEANITGKYTALEGLLSFIDSMGEEVKTNKYILITQEILDYINKHLIFFENDMPNIGEKWYVERVVTYPTACEGKPVVEVINDEKCWMRLPKDIVVIQEETNAKFKVGDTVRRKRDGLEAEVIDVCNGIATVRCEDWDDTIIDKEWELVEKPVSTRDKLIAMSDGKVHLGWLVDAKIVEFEECMKEFYTALNNIPKDIDGVTRIKDADEVLHNYSKKLISMAREIPIEEDLEVPMVPKVLVDKM